MAAPRPRYDGYGKPLPDLAEARQASLFEHGTNERQRRVLMSLIETYCRELCHRGIHATVSLRWSVLDGILDANVEVTVLRRWRTEPPDAP
jgi:hypothetical protein